MNSLVDIRPTESRARAADCEGKTIAQINNCMQALGNYLYLLATDPGLNDQLRGLVTQTRGELAVLHAHIEKLALIARRETEGRQEVARFGEDAVFPADPIT